MTDVLIADDETNIRRLVRAALSGGSRAVLEAADGDAAWALIREHRPVVVLLDVMMPGMSGLELTRAIRAAAELASTRIVLLTSKAQAGDVSNGIAAGADLYLTKPFSPTELVRAVDRLAVR